MSPSTQWRRSPALWTADPLTTERQNVDLRTHPSFPSPGRKAETTPLSQVIYKQACVSKQPQRKPKGHVSQATMPPATLKSTCLYNKPGDEPSSLELKERGCPHWINRKFWQLWMWIISNLFQIRKLRLMEDKVFTPKQSFKKAQKQNFYVIRYMALWHPCLLVCLCW